MSFPAILPVKQLPAIIVALLFCTKIMSQAYQPVQSNVEAREIFQDSRYGMFIHWGPFSILGDGEWVMNNHNITVKNYTRLVDFFNPISFDAAKWVGLAKRSGMKYITVITRHHDGFSLWDTKYSDFNIMHTTYNKDIVKMMAEECHKQGLSLFLYYSLLDWRRDDYSYSTGFSGQGTGRTTKGSWNEYLTFMKNQLTELLTNYGKIGGIWFDGYWDQKRAERLPEGVEPKDWHISELYELIHKIQPQCLVGNNHHIEPMPGEDFQMFEKDLPGKNTTGFGSESISRLPLETCETMNDSWGFNITDVKYKSSIDLIHYMVKAAGLNANFLLNIGPMPNGNIQQEFMDTLAVIGQWLRQNGESIYGTRGNVLPAQDWGVLTQKDRKIFVHVLKPQPRGGFIFIPGLKQHIRSASSVNNGKPIRFKQQEEGVFIYPEDGKCDSIDTIFQLNAQ